MSNTNLTEDQIKAITKVYGILNILNLEVHSGKDIDDNDEILIAMEVIEAEFQNDIFE